MSGNELSEKDVKWAVGTVKERAFDELLAAARRKGATEEGLGRALKTYQGALDFADIAEENYGSGYTGADSLRKIALDQIRPVRPFTKGVGDAEMACFLLYSAAKRVDQDWKVGGGWAQRVRGLLSNSLVVGEAWEQMRWAAERGEALGPFAQKDQSYDVLSFDEEDLEAKGVVLDAVEDPSGLLDAWGKAVAERVYDDGDLLHGCLMDALAQEGYDPRRVMRGSDDPALGWEGAVEAFDTIAFAHDNGRASGVYADLDARRIWAETASCVPDLPVFDDPRVVMVQDYDVLDPVDEPSELVGMAAEALAAADGRPSFSLTPGQVAGIDEAMRNIYGSWKEALGGHLPLSEQCSRAEASCGRDAELRGGAGSRDHEGRD